MSYRIFSRAIRIALPCVGVLAVAGVANASFIIDDFTATEDGDLWRETLSIQNTSADRNELMPALTDNVLGGRRQTFITAEEIGIADFDFVRGTLAPSAGVFDYASSANARGTLTFIYDGIEPDFKKDFSGKDGINIAFTHFDFANEAALPVTITLRDGSGGEADVTLSLGENELNLFFAMSDFTNVDLTDIRNVQVDFNPGIATDFRLAQMSVLPAPGVLALLAMGGVIGSRRRRRTDGSRPTA